MFILESYREKYSPKVENEDSKEGSTENKNFFDSKNLMPKAFNLRQKTVIVKNNQIRDY